MCIHDDNDKWVEEMVNVCKQNIECMWYWSLSLVTGWYHQALHPAEPACV